MRTLRIGMLSVLVGVIAGILVGCASPKPEIVSGPVLVAEAPPTAQIETPTEAPSQAHVWVEGYWVYQNDRYIWIPGHWELRPRPNAVWVPGSWSNKSGGWLWTPGHWR
ncbi:MAG TPA: YXWGXW repeat-containing protein [Clostridia bacterium]|nr:YXWGXW repeat-containing protein [Clostridia bacterium]